MNIMKLATRLYRKNRQKKHLNFTVKQTHTTKTSKKVKRINILTLLINSEF